MGTDTRGQREHEPSRRLEGRLGEGDSVSEALRLSASGSVTPAVSVANQKLIGHKRGHVQVSEGGTLSRALGETRDGSREEKGRTPERLGVRLTQWGFHL